MPQQRKQVTWAQLRVGLLIIASLAVFAVGVFFISGKGGFFERKYKLRTYFSSASGLRAGAQVQLAGIPGVGVVEEIRISSAPEPSRAVEVMMSVGRRYQNQIRTDSTAKLATAGLLGEAFIDISRGVQGRPVPDGGELKSLEEPDIKRIVQNTNDVITNLRVLSAKFNDITSQIEKGHGSIGRLIYDEAFYNRLSEATGTAERLLREVEKGRGTLGKILEDETLYQRMLAAIDHLNKVAEDIQHGKGSFAKFLNDPSIYDQVNQAVTRFNSLMDNVNSGKGTIGKLANDPRLYDRMNETFAHINTISERMEKGDGTLGKLSTNETLYTNLSESSHSLREFLTDFRKNPKKFLTLRVRIF